jgi:ATP-binding cassette subfamily F protein 3
VIFLQNVAKFFQGQPLFRNADVSVHRGDRIGMVGPNGAGKSTILGMMEGSVTPDEGQITIEKKIRMGVLHQELLDGGDGPILEEVVNISPEVQEIRRRLRVLEERLDTVSEFDEDAEALLEEHGHVQHEFERFDGYTLEARALKILAGLGFQPSDGNRKWSEFSGGWRMRVALAKILLADPDVLLLDEPTNHLDLESLLWVEEYLTGFKGALVLVSHDRAFLNKLVTRIVEVDRGKVTPYAGNFDEYEKNKGMQEQILESAYRNQEEKRKKIQKFIDQNRVKARTASRAQSRIKMLEKMEKIEPPKRVKTVKFKLPDPPPSGKRTLEIHGLRKRYGDKIVYDGFDLALDRGERLGLVGPNGAGKSTLMKIMAHIVSHDGGTVKYGHQVKPGYFAQHQSEHLRSEFTVLQEASSSSPGATEQEVRTLLGAFLFSGDDVYKKVKVLSGGEKSRLALARILLSPPNLLLMDEPTNHLDISSCEVLEHALETYQGTLVLITHDRRLMNRVCTGILEILPGKTEHFLGNYDDFLYKKRLMENRPNDVDEQPTERPDAARQPEETQPLESREARKERKRKEAQARRELSRRKAPLVDRIQQIERELEAKQLRKQKIEELMADPATYNNKELMLPLLEEDPALAREIRRLEERWTELQTQLDELEKEAVAG